MPRPRVLLLLATFLFSLSLWHDARANPLNSGTDFESIVDYPTVISGYVRVKAKKNKRLTIRVEGTYDGGDSLEVVESQTDSPRIRLTIPIDSAVLGPDGGYSSLVDEIEVTITAKLAGLKSKRSATTYLSGTSSSSYGSCQGNGARGYADGKLNFQDVVIEYFINIDPS